MCLTLAILGIQLVGAAQPEPAIKNVILICADDLNCDLSCYQRGVAPTPSIDRLAARGVVFERAYCQYPVCNPSRTSFLSGRRPTTSRVVDNETPARSRLPSAPFLAESFRKNGFRTMKVGKITHTGDRFEDPASWEIDIREDKTAKNPPKNQVIGTRGRHGIVLSADDDKTWDGSVARRACAYLDDRADKPQPFFLAVGFRRPHSPYIAPKRYHDLVPAAKVPVLDDPPAHRSGIPRIALSYHFHIERLPAEDRAETAAAYYASIAFMDAQLSLLLDRIDLLNLWSNSVVIFLGDHGYHLGEHGGLWHKMSLFEESARVPLIIAAPGIRPARCPNVVELLDLYPTLIDLFKQTNPPGLEGKSLRPCLESPQVDREWSAVTVVSRKSLGDGRLDPDYMGQSLRTNRYRYTVWPDGSRELYDHQVDPREHRNLINDPSMKSTVDDLARRLVGASLQR